MSYEIDCNLDEKLTPVRAVWSRLFTDFSLGDIVAFPASFGEMMGIFYDSFQGAREKTHIRFIDGWSNKEGRVKVREFIIWTDEYRRARLVMKGEVLGSLRQIMSWWRARRKWYERGRDLALSNYGGLVS